MKSTASAIRRSYPIAVADTRNDGKGGTAAIGQTNPTALVVGLLEEADSLYQQIAPVHKTYSPPQIRRTVDTSELLDVVLPVEKDG